MYLRWKDEVNFLVVYIQEAHPWPRGSKTKGKTVIPEPLTLEERAQHGQTCNHDLGLTIPMVLDGMDNAVEQASPSDAIESRAAELESAREPAPVHEPRSERSERSERSKTG